MKDIDWERLDKYIQDNLDNIYCVYAGILENWEDSSDEVYFHQCGWIEDSDAHTQTEDGTPLVYIHYMKEEGEPFSDYIVDSSAAKAYAAVSEVSFLLQDCRGLEVNYEENKKFD